MSAEKPHIIITDSNGQKQSNLHQDYPFFNVADQERKLEFAVLIQKKLLKITEKIFWFPINCIQIRSIPFNWGSSRG